MHDSFALISEAWSMRMFQKIAYNVLQQEQFSNGCWRIGITVTINYNQLQDMQFGKTQGHQDR